jgi:hypothetical protein
MIPSFECGVIEGSLVTWRNKTLTNTSVLDYILIPKVLNGSVLKTKIDGTIPYEVSYHYPVSLTFIGDTFLSGEKVWNVRPLQWTKADNVQIKMYETEVDLILGRTMPEQNCCDTMESYADTIVASLHSAASMYIPTGKYKPYLKPYWKSCNLDFYHYQMRRSRRHWKLNKNNHAESDDSYVNYKKTKCEFRRQKRKAEREWERKK